MESTFAQNDLELETAELKAARLVYRAINHELRLRILTLVHKKKRMYVGRIYKTLALKQSEASAHLGILRRAGFVTTIQHKSFVYYSVNYKRLEELHEVSENLLRI